jgi:NADH:ubiquinone oxidoreductase subunit 2 (subunit N)
LYQAYFYHVSLIIMVVGFLFKISTAPSHLWSPDVYDGTPTIVTTFVAIIGKISIFAFFLEFIIRNTLSLILTEVVFSYLVVYFH